MLQSFLFIEQGIFWSFKLWSAFISWSVFAFFILSGFSFISFIKLCFSLLLHKNTYKSIKSLSLGVHVVSHTDLKEGYGNWFSQEENCCISFFLFCSIIFCLFVDWCWWLRVILLLFSMWICMRSLNTELVFMWWSLNDALHKGQLLLFLYQLYMQDLQNVWSHVDMHTGSIMTHAHTIQVTFSCISFWIDFFGILNFFLWQCDQLCKKKKVSLLKKNWFFGKKSHIQWTNQKWHSTKDQQICKSCFFYCYLTINRIWTT